MNNETNWQPPMTEKDAAEHIISKLVPEEIAYARDPARGEFRGFAALHDKCDANMLIPGAEEYDASNEAQTAWMNRVMDRVTAIIIASGGAVQLLGIECALCRKAKDDKGDPAPAHIGHYECSGCGQKFKRKSLDTYGAKDPFKIDFHFCPSCGGKIEAGE